MEWVFYEEITHTSGFGVLFDFEDINKHYFDSLQTILANAEKDNTDNSYTLIRHFNKKYNYISRPWTQTIKLWSRLANTNECAPNVYKIKVDEDIRALQHQGYSMKYHIIVRDYGSD